MMINSVNNYNSRNYAPKSVSKIKTASKPLNFLGAMSRDEAVRALNEDRRIRCERGHFYWHPDYTTHHPDPKKYQKVDDFLSRSAMPTLGNLSWLKKQGVSDIVDLRLPDDNQLINERAEAEKLGIKYHSIPICAWDFKKEKLDEVMSLLDKIKKDGGKCHIHCEEGVDRTGMCTFAYKTINGIGTPEENIQQWFDAGHDYSSYSNLITETIFYCYNYEK